MGCRDKIINRLSDYIDTNCYFEGEKDSCLININNVVDFHWDRLFIFEPWSMPNDISRELGINYNGNYVEDNTRRLIFIKNKEIVYEETYNIRDKTFDFAETCFGRDTCYFDSPEFYVKRKLHISQASHSLYLLYPKNDID